MKKIAFIAILMAVALLPACGIADSNNDSAEYQVTIQLESTSIVPGYAPRIVYEANVVSSNRVIEEVILVDFTSYLNSRSGTLPTNFAEPFTANLRRNRPPDNTFEVVNTFYDLR
jgi:hypothetical protein